MSNLPDDWNCYWRVCDRCNHKYHASEGGCGCADDLEPCRCGSSNWDNDLEDTHCQDCGGEPGSQLQPCQCGDCQWDGDWDDPRCEKCHTGPSVHTMARNTIHVARKDYPEYKIVAGERYQRLVSGGYYPGGARWLSTSKKKVAK